MRFTYLDILEQCFHDKILGYNKEEVDTFLQSLASDFKDMSDEIEGLKKESDKKCHRINHLEEQLKELESKNLNEYRETFEQLSTVRQKANEVIKKAQNSASLKYKNAEKELNQIREETKLLKKEKAKLLENLKADTKSYIESFFKNKQANATSDSKS